MIADFKSTSSGFLYGVLLGINYKNKIDIRLSKEIL